MNKNQEDTLNMFQATSQVLQNNSAVWTGNVPFATSVKQLNVNIQQIETLQEQQVADITGVTVDKKAQRIALAAQIYYVASIIAFYATDTNNASLRLSVLDTRSRLLAMRENDLVAKAANVVQAATDNAASLTAYGLVPADITNLSTILSTYQAMMGTPRDAQVETESATNQMAPLISATSKLLKSAIDRGIELFKASNGDFYNQYFIARKTINSAVHVRSLDISISDKNGELAKVIVSIDNGTIKRRSTKKGRVLVQNLTEGTHSITMTMPGYTTQTVSFNVVQGETTKVNIVMVAVS
jgi:hypothetical protein